MNISIGDDENHEDVDMEKLLAQQQESQEKLALEMLKSVESIKHNTMAAKRAIGDDNKVNLKIKRF